MTDSKSKGKVKSYCMGMIPSQRSTPVKISIKGFFSVSEIFMPEICVSNNF